MKPSYTYFDDCLCKSITYILLPLMNYLNRLILMQTLASQRFAGARLAVWASGCGDMCRCSFTEPLMVWGLSAALSSSSLLGFPATAPGKPPRAGASFSLLPHYLSPPLPPRRRPVTNLAYFQRNPCIYVFRGSSKLDAWFLKDTSRSQVTSPSKLMLCL
jgi:hypothetical protein